MAAEDISGAADVYITFRRVIAARNPSRVANWLLECSGLRLERLPSLAVAWGNRRRTIWGRHGAVIISR